MTTDPVEALLDELGITDDRDLVGEIVRTGLGLGADGTERLNLKITASAIAEMRDAFAALESEGAVDRIVRSYLG